MKKYRILVLVLTMADTHTHKIDVGNFLISIINKHANLNMVALKFVIPVIKINRIPNRQLLTKIFQSKQKPQMKLSILAFWPHELTLPQQEKSTKKINSSQKDKIRSHTRLFCEFCKNVLPFEQKHTQKTVCVQM